MLFGLIADVLSAYVTVSVIVGGFSAWKAWSGTTEDMRKNPQLCTVVVGKALLEGCALPTVAVWKACKDLDHSTTTNTQK